SLENSQNGMSQQVDYDLTVMDRNMVYATVFQLMINPDQYIGKSFKIKGNHYTVCDEVTHKYYHYVLIKDATACCAQGLEFVLEGDNQDEYPADEAEVEIIGNFETYKEEGDESLYCRLKSASMKVIN
ncbi:MAG: hypothetical protein GX895_02160, partial [Clostridiales bacterium]|nr:hypothetical protein [Clostridiales bacterium]